MNICSVLLCVTVLTSSLATVRPKPVRHESHCFRFVENFADRLRRLRQDYSRIRDFYEAKDNLDKALLNESVEDSFNSQFACQATNSILDFYLHTVLPAALAEVHGTKLRPHVESIQQIFDKLKTDVTECKEYFDCKEQFDIKDLNATYTQLQSKGLYKAMNELDILFNYIETYLASKRPGNHAAAP